jgi:hypothetical protein
MPALPHDVELLRVALLYLETRQVSPRATVIIDLRDEAADLDYDQQVFEDGLNLLLDLDYIEGPGSDANGLWLFRKLTRKGIEFVRATRDPADWARMKHQRAVGAVPLR